MPEFNVINPNANPNIAEYINKQINGRQMKALALKRITEIQRLRAQGRAKPASILNFNPVPLRLESGLPVGKVPSIIDPSIPDDRKLEFEYKSRKYKATIVTIDTPHFYPWITDVFKSPEQGLEDGVGVYDIKHCLQIEMAYDFWQDYNGQTFNAITMGGVVAFQGDRHALKSDFLDIPTPMVLENYEREFVTERKPIGEVIAQALDTQKNYYDLQIMTGSNYWNDPDNRKNISNAHLIWAQYGLDMGYREKPVDWHVSTDEPDDTCGGCGAAKKRALAVFCHACNRPYDALAAFLGDEIGFDSSYLNRISDEDWPKVLAHENRRRTRRGLPPLDLPGDELVRNPIEPKKKG